LRSSQKVGRANRASHQTRGTALTLRNHFTRTALKNCIIYCYAHIWNKLPTIYAKWRQPASAEAATPIQTKIVRNLLCILSIVLSKYSTMSSRFNLWSFVTKSLLDKLFRLIL
jgi:hypothetical protein